MYIALSKKKDGLNIVDAEKRYYVKLADLEGLILGVYKNPHGKPIITLNPLPPKQKPAEV